MDRHRILVVDDEADIREVTALALEVGGHDVICAESGAAGLEAAIRHQPTIILLDVMMPGMNGWETHRRLQEREETRGIPVIFMTAKAFAASELRTIQHGAFGIIEKPFDPIELPGTVIKIIQDLARMEMPSPTALVPFRASGHRC